MAKQKLSSINWFILLFSFFIVVIIGALGYLTFYTIQTNDTKEYIELVKAAASSMLFAGVVYSARQFHLNQRNIEETNNWNKQQLAMIESRNANEIISKIIQKLNKEINYTEDKSPYKVKYLHTKFGNFNDDMTDFEFSENGQALKDDIIKLLNTLEYIATGVNSNILDEEIVKRLWRGKIMHAYNRFKNYIAHLRVEHEWGDKVYKEIEILLKKWEAEKCEEKPH